MTDDTLELLATLEDMDDRLDELLDGITLEFDELLLIDELEGAMLLDTVEDLLLDIEDLLLEDEVIMRGGSIPEIKPSLP
jgi:hypothetical protein